MRMKVPEHEHPLKLIDLRQEYPLYDEEEEEEEEEEKEEDDGHGHGQTTEEGFQSHTCGRCSEDITMQHRYYYKCIGSCDYSLHEFCGELLTRLVHASHPHPLTQIDGTWTEHWYCSVCKHSYKPHEMGYTCSSCHFFLDIKCAVKERRNMIHHPCHPHLLMSAIQKPILCKCNACGRRHDGIFYNCTVCYTYTVHKDCAFLPKKLLIQKATHDAFYHIHPLTISYSFPIEDQMDKYIPKCRVCGGDFFHTEDLWTYKCDKCLYYTHVDCATRVPPAGSRKSIKNYEDTDHPHLLHLPFPDVSYSIPKHFLFGGSKSRFEEVSLKHNSHQHPLILVDQTSLKNNNSWCHDPMKKIQLLCNGCMRPITNTPFFKCSHEDEHCNYSLHEWCTRLPAKIENHPGHSQHTLVLMENNFPKKFFGVFHCDVCGLPCNGFSYCCVECEYYVDVTCGLIPTEITHNAHPNHLLSLIDFRLIDFKSLPVGQRIYMSPIPNCLMCLRPHLMPNKSVRKLVKKLLVFSCKECAIYIHSECALSSPKTIRHKYDKHPMHLSYLPIENHKSDYFCEICEKGLNPHASFYHCQNCVQSIHSSCALSILQSETETYSIWHEGVHYFTNIKFGGIHNTDGHPHPLSFSQGTVLDGQCSRCGENLRYNMIFKCLECEFAVDYDCCKRLEKRFRVVYD